MEGDLDGFAVLEISGDASRSRTRVAWELELRKPLLRMIEHIAWPILSLSHDWVVASAVAGFRRFALTGRSDGVATGPAG